MQLVVNVENKGQYRVFFKVWKPQPDLVELRLDRPDIYNIQQIHNITGTGFPVWSVSSSLGKSFVSEFW